MRQKKLEHHAGRTIRVVPIFAELRPHLERWGVSEKAINAGIGNTGRVRQRHYHAVRVEDWAAVTGKMAQIPVRTDSHRPSGAINPA